MLPLLPSAAAAIGDGYVCGTSGWFMMTEVGYEEGRACAIIVEW